MKLKMLVFALAILGSAAIAQPTTEPTAVSKHVTKILSRGDGASEQTAFKVKSVRDEYEVLAALNLTPGKQSLVVRRKAYDVIEATDKRTAVTREVWFDISSYYPEF